MTVRKSRVSIFFFSDRSLIFRSLNVNALDWFTKENATPYSENWINAVQSHLICHLRSVYFFPIAVNDVLIRFNESGSWKYWHCSSILIICFSYSSKDAINRSRGWKIWKFFNGRTPANDHMHANMLAASKCSAIVPIGPNINEHTSMR